MKYNSLKGAQEGDRVWTCTEGWGKIVRIDDGVSHTIVVIFRDLVAALTPEGRLYTTDRYPSAFFAPWAGEHGKDPYPPRPSPKTKRWRWVLVYRDSLSELRSSVLHGYYTSDEMAEYCTEEGHDFERQLFKIESTEVEV